jgi:hypothetical protein
MLGATDEAIDVRSKIAYPTGDCLARARQYVDDGNELLQVPLSPDTQARVERVLDGLHPIAKQVLARTEGIGFAQNIPDAAAVFLPCDVDQSTGRGGFVLIDIGQFPLDQPLHDAEVPALYWKSLSGPVTSRPAYRLRTLNKRRATRPDHAMRYLVLHELGHALSLLGGEFELDEQSRIQVSDTHGFVGYSWRLMTTSRRYLPLLGEGPVVQAVVPRSSLDTFEWGSILAALDADAALLAPGYALAQPRSDRARAHDVCEVVEKLPLAGFVTPTAARYPTEDFAEMFAHAILAEEGKISPSDRVRVDLPNCPPRIIAAPYFSPGVDAKRRYIENGLGFRKPKPGH